MSTDQFNKEDFLKRLIEGCIRTTKKSPEDFKKLYDGYKLLIENQIKKKPDTYQTMEQLQKMLEKAYIMFSNPEFVEIIKENNVTYRQFILQYGEMFLEDDKMKDNIGDKTNFSLNTYQEGEEQSAHKKTEKLPLKNHVRKYNMSDRFDASMIASQDRDCKRKKVKYVAKKGEEYVYTDLEGGKVSIQEIGRLYYEAWNGLKSAISKYRVIKQVSEGALQTDEIFSNIRIFEMQNPEYREAVLQELLSENNIKLSKTGGYVGEIVDTPTNDPSFKIGCEKTISTDYFYRVNQNYTLTYQSEEIAATMLQAEIEKQQEKQKEGQERT